MNFTRINTLHLFVSAFVAFTALSGAQQPGSLEPGVVKEVSPGIYKLGEIQIDKEKNTITFPGRINMANGVLEYLLVGPKGSTHESLLVSEVPVNDVHTAMLLLGAKGAGLNAPSPEQQPPAQITDEYLKNAPELKGDRVFISAKWQQKDGADEEMPVEDLVWNSQTKKPAERGPWTYTGSMFGSDGKFLAQQEEAFAAMVPYPPALISNPRKVQSDSLYQVNEKAVPPIETPVQISIRLDQPAAKPQ